MEIDNVKTGVYLNFHSKESSRWSEAEMPENEVLLPNSRNASRWRQIGERMDEGLSPTDAFPVIQNDFYAFLRKCLATGVRRAFP